MEKELSKPLGVAAAWLVFSAITAVLIAAQETLRDALTAAAIFTVACAVSVIFVVYRRAVSALVESNRKLKIVNIRLQDDKDELVTSVVQHEAAEKEMREKVDENTRTIGSLKVRDNELTQANRRLEATIDGLSIDRRLQDILRSKLEEHIRAQDQMEASIRGLKAAKVELEAEIKRLIKEDPCKNT